MCVVEGCEGGLVLQQLGVRNVHTDWTELPHIVNCLESQTFKYSYRPQSTYIPRVNTVSVPSPELGHPIPSPPGECDPPEPMEGEHTSV
jgi:hypothetical protein